jgi:hypothetical protein
MSFNFFIQFIPSFTPMRKAFAFTALAALTLTTTHAQAPGDLRVALVIGNDAYTSATPLKNAANDAKSMSETLRELGFFVIEIRDGTRAQMAEGIAKVRDKLKGKHGIGMLYYSGHGMQMEARNYMIPVDAKLRSMAEVPSQNVDVDQVILAFKAAGNRMNILVLDACRNNPFDDVAAVKGLAPIDAPTGTILAYATAPGNVASDGDTQSKNGLYTGFLLKELKTPQVKIEDIFKRVRLNVRQASRGRQIPWESTSLEDDFYFNSGLKPAQKESETDLENAFAIEKAYWDKIKNSVDANDFFTFLQKHPNGSMSETAQFAIDRLQKTTLIAQQGANSVQMLASGSNRYKLGDTFSYEVRDGSSKEVTSRLTQKVTFADDQRVVLNDGMVELDQMGGMRKNSSGTKDPAILQVPADLALGKKWRSTFTNTKPDGSVSRSYWDAKVVALEEIATAMGIIKAFKVQRSGFANGSGGGVTQLNGTMWIDPRVMLVVRNDLLYRHKGKVTENSSTVMTAMNRAP